MDSKIIGFHEAEVLDKEDGFPIKLSGPGNQGRGEDVDHDGAVDALEGEEHHIGVVNVSRLGLHGIYSLVVSDPLGFCDSPFGNVASNLEDAKWFVVSLLVLDSLDVLMVGVEGSVVAEAEGLGRVTVELWLVAAVDEGHLAFVNHDGVEDDITPGILEGNRNPTPGGGIRSGIKNLESLNLVEAGGECLRNHRRQVSLGATGDVVSTDAHATEPLNLGACLLEAGGSRGLAEGRIGVVARKDQWEVPRDSGDSVEESNIGQGHVAVCGWLKDGGSAVSSGTVLTLWLCGGTGCAHGGRCASDSTAGIVGWRTRCLGIWSTESCGLIVPVGGRRR